MNYFYNQMFNPQTVNPAYYNTMRSQMSQQHEMQQNIEIAKAQKAIHELCDAVRKLDDVHQQQAFWACLQQLAVEMGWQ